MTNSATAPIVLRRSLGDRLMIAFATTMLLGLGVVMLIAAAALFAKSAVAALFLLLLAVFLGGMGAILLRELLGRWRTRVTLADGTLSLDLPTGRSISKAPPLRLTLPLTDVAGLETREEAFKSLGFTTLQRAYVLLRRDGSQILLGADRPMVDPFYGTASVAIAAAAGLTVRDIGTVDGTSGFMGVANFRAPDWNAPSLPPEASQKRRSAAALTMQIVIGVVLMTVVVRACNAMLGS